MCWRLGKLPVDFVASVGHNAWGNHAGPGALGSNCEQVFICLYLCAGGDAAEAAEEKKDEPEEESDEVS